MSKSRHLHILYDLEVLIIYVQHFSLLLLLFLFKKTSLRKVPYEKGEKALCIFRPFSLSTIILILASTLCLLRLNHLKGLSPLLHLVLF